MLASQLNEEDDVTRQDSLDKCEDECLIRPYKGRKDHTGCFGTKTFQASERAESTDISPQPSSLTIADSAFVGNKSIL
jgi:hypothetical protein